MTDLVACYWTVAGPVEIHTGREWSLFDWRDRCAQAARVGFTGLGLWRADITHQLEGGRTLSEMAKIFTDAGLKDVEIEFLQDFFMPEGSPEKTRSDEVKALLFDAAAAFDAHHIKVGNIPNEGGGIPTSKTDLDGLAESVAKICAEAAEHTQAKIAYEITPFDPDIESLELGLELIERAGAPSNLGVGLDTWHIAKMGIGLEQLRALDPDRIAWVEISDGHYHNLEDRVYEVTCERALPGEGEFPLRDHIRALQAAGYPGPWGAEVLSAPLRELPIEQAFDRVYETTIAQFEDA